MSFDLEPLPDTPRPPPQSVDRSRPCLSCGYNIRGLPVSGNCPECGVPVARSLQGNLLIHAAPEHLAAIHHGTVLILAGKIIALLLQIGVVLVPVIVLLAVISTGGRTPQSPAFLPWFSTPEYRFFSSVGELATSGAILIGWWLLSRPDPGQVGADDLLTARKLVRIAVVVQLAAGLLTVAVHAAGALGLVPKAKAPPDPAEIATIVVAILSGVAALVGFFASMRYLAQLARRFAPSASALCGSGR